MRTLYRDYRPQNFADILGQKHIKITLQNEISAGKTAQAFLFCGPRAVGKTTMARVLAKAVNCLELKPGESEPCGQCASCQSITAGNNLDVIEIDAASNTGVDNVRENIISFSRLAPGQAKYKVFIIDEVHMLSPSAFNALLKIIEEPPTYVIFILCTTEIHKVPATIVSRCERFDFKRIGVADVVGKLRRISNQEGVEIDDDVLEAVARRSGGHLRDAESLLGQIFSLGEKRISLEQAELVIPHYNSSEAVDLLEYLMKKDAAKAVALINQLADSGANLRNFNSELVALLRKLIIFKVSPELSNNLGLNLGDTLELRLNNIAASSSVALLINYARRLLDAYNEKNLLIAQLPLELAVIEICAETVAPAVRPAATTTGPVAAAKSVPAAAIPKSAPTNNIMPASDLPENEVIEKWPEVLVKIKKHNHSLSFVLQNCEPQALQAGKLYLTFKYKFHQDRLNDPNIRSLVELTLAEVFGSSVTIESRLDENLELKRHVNGQGINEEPVPPSATPLATEPKPGGAMMDNLLAAFGGEVIG